MKKPFNIAEVKANPKCRIETRDGKHHLEFVFHDEATRQVVLRDIEKKSLIIYRDDGGFWASPEQPNALDLFIEPELTAFEEYVLNMINTYVHNEHLADVEDAKRMGAELMDLAVEDLRKYGACTIRDFQYAANRMADALHTKFPEGITNEQIICEVIDRGLMADVVAQTADWVLEDALERRKQARSSGGLGGIE